MLILLLVALVGYGGIIAWFRANENRLLYYPERGPVGVPDASFRLDARRVTFTTTDHLQLVAWEIPPPAGDTLPFWLLVLHGNAGNLATPGRPAHDRQLHDMGLGVLALDYRGYGESDGTPDEAGLYTDARAAYDHLRAAGIPAERIILYGHSLGSGVAVELATTVAAAGLILEGAFTSVADLAGELYPWLPIHWMVRNRFESLERIGTVRMPILVIHGRADTVIPISHGRRLFAAAGEPKTLLEVAGGHDDAFQVGAVEYQAGIRTFLATLR